MHIRRTPEDEPSCICGARLDSDGPALCRKCSSRSRWQRRHDDGSRRHLRPGRRPGRDEPPH